MSIPLVCPSCRSTLEMIFESSLSCVECASVYPSVDGYWKFTDESFDPIAREADEGRPTIMEGERTSGSRFVGKYLIPKLQGLQLESAKVLSIGCGFGADVAELRQWGHEGYGIDLWRARAPEWANLGLLPEWCYVADARALPFRDKEFDVVLCIGLIEHIGTVGDTAQLQPDYQFQRQAFLKEALRVAKHGVFLTTPNRTCPADFGHATSSNKILRWVGRRTGVWFHSPFEPFYLSYRNIEDSIDGSPVEVTPWELRNYFGFAIRSSHRWVKFFMPFLALYFGALDKAPTYLRKSWLNPFILAFIKPS